MLEDDQKRVLFSMDLSANERMRSKESNMYLDVNKLIERAGEVQSFQLPRETWLYPLATALKKRREASWELEIRFKDSRSHTYKFDLEATEHDLHFRVASGGKPSEDESPK
jgi:hypothetical protein